ncbi:TrmH family RNA methyltransferase [Streptomyces pacificus]|uniref:rRNA methyltransferase n=1 Tax=Streptomyces pacificus TaxID=2705029 RepID=A0A6A0AVX9_9ACTN|nr:TrmH family RNA methyltransferase [Streptomyces pacificus]GFH36501.1 rRNA methyltransferase [Streptomyces pacificus]
MSSETQEPVQYDDGYAPEVGVGPHPAPWPEGAPYDPELLAHGDRRNVADRYRYWTREAIIADLDTRRHDFHVAVENWGHDFNIGSVVRTANAFLAKEIHIVGRRRWNRRGAMVTDRYQHVRHHPDTGSLTAWAAAGELPIIGIDNLPGAVPLERTALPRRCVLLFGQEGPGLTEEARARAAVVCSIAQFGSTRSINAGAAAAIAMHAWIQRHADVPPTL